jgi:transposase InsO family protein
VSERRACTALGVDRSSVRYRSCRPDDGIARARLRELAVIRRRFGYRRLHILMTREGLVMNHKRLRRLYREERLQVRRRGGRKRALGTRAPMAIPPGPNQRWSLDFLSVSIGDNGYSRPFWGAGTSLHSTEERSAPSHEGLGCCERTANLPTIPQRIPSCFSSSRIILSVSLITKKIGTLSILSQLVPQLL